MAYYRCFGSGGGGESATGWQSIKNAVIAGTVSQIVSNGDYFTVRAGSERLVYIACVNTYGLGEVDFIPAYCMETTRQHHTTNTNEGGWRSSDIRTYLNGTFYNSLPTDLKNVISIKPVKVTIGSGANTLETVEDYIWLPTEKEVFGAVTFGGSTESAVNNQYPVFTEQALRIKRANYDNWIKGTGNGIQYWLSSPYVSGSSTSQFCAAYTGGSETSGAACQASQIKGILPCFRIGRD